MKISNKSNILKYVTLLIVFYSLQAFAQDQAETINEDDAAEVNQMADAKRITSASDNMEDWFESVLDEFGLESFGENNGMFILSDMQSVSLKPTDPQYGDALINAYDKAMLGLQEQYVMVRFGRTVTDKVRSFYSDTSTNAREIEMPKLSGDAYLSKILMLLDKNLDVASMELDKQLIDLGVNSNELASLSPTMKKDLFRDRFLKSTIRQASGSIAGLFPIQTSVITDAKGRTVVGVVAIASSKTLQIAKDISLQRKSLMSGKGKDILSLLPEENEDFIGTLGVRLAFDLDGSPAIISYGIASYYPTGDDDYINDELKSDAKNQAIANADAQIAEIINGRMNVDNERQTGEEIRKYVEREMKFGSDTVEKEFKNIMKITTENARTTASAQLQGISTVKNWRHTLESGQKFVGAVRVWKYGTLNAVKSFNKPGKNQAKKQNGDFKQSQKTSKKVNDLDDF